MAPITPTCASTRSLRTRSAAVTPVTPATPVSAKKTPKVEKTTPTKTTEETTTPNKKTPRKPAPKKRAAATDIQQRPPKRRNVRKSEPGEADPFSFDDKEDDHPELFKKVTVERRSFGAMKFLSKGNSDGSKYANFEKNATERRGLVPDLLNKSDAASSAGGSSSKNTPKGKKATPASTKRNTKKSESEIEGGKTLNLDVDDDDEEADIFEAPKPTPNAAVKKPATPKTPKVTETAPVLTEEEQTKADDEKHVTYPPGARVFAIWGKEYYSAIVADRDGLGRYKVFYTEDQSIRQIPSSGIVPLNLIKEDIEVSIVGEKDEDGERIVYQGKILSVPNIENPAEWAKGVYSIEVTNEENIKPQTRNFDWFDIYVTEPQYKQIMKTKKNPTELGQENIIEAEGGRRTRRSIRPNPVVAAAVTPSPARSRAKPKPKTPASDEIVEEDGAEAVAEESDKEEKEEKATPVKGKARAKITPAAKSPEVVEDDVVEDNAEGEDAAEEEEVAKKTPAKRRKRAPARRRRGKQAPKSAKKVEDDASSEGEAEGEEKEHETAEEEDEEKEPEVVEEKPKPKATPRGKRAAPVVEENDDEAEDEEVVKKETPAKGRANTRASPRGRAAAVKAVEEKDEEVVDEDVESEGEEEALARGKAKAKTTPRGKKAAKVDEDVQMEETEAEKEEVSPAEDEDKEEEGDDVDMEQDVVEEDVTSAGKGKGKSKETEEVNEQSEEEDVTNVEEADEVEETDKKDDKEDVVEEPMEVDEEVVAESPKEDAKTEASEANNVSQVVETNGHNGHEKVEEENSSSAEPRSVEPQQIFNNLYFILTSANRQTGPPPFTKKDVKKSIENRGGVVIENFDSIKEGDVVYLIADTFYRTHKYLTALSLSIPTVSYKWIEESVEQNELLDHGDFMLDAGESVIDQTRYPWKSAKGKIFPGKSIAIFSQRNVSDPRIVNFREIWAPLVKNVGGSVENSVPAEMDELKQWLIDNKTVDYFIIDEGTSREIIDLIKSSGSETVNSEWLIQCIVTGEITPKDTLERYRPKTL